MPLSMRQRLTTEVSTAHLTGLPAKHKGFMAAPFIGSLDAKHAAAGCAAMVAVIVEHAKEKRKFQPYIIHK